MKDYTSPYQTLAPALATIKNGLGANQTEFYRMVARLMPREVEAKVFSQFTLQDDSVELSRFLFLVIAKR